jgi:hypothetical protein
VIAPERPTSPARKPSTRRRLARAILRALWFGAALPGVAPLAAAQGADGIQAGHRAFAAQYVAALAGGDAQRMRALIHPRSLACITDRNRDFFDEMLARSMRPAAVERHQVTSVRRIDPAEPPGVPPALGAYPATPTHRIQFDVIVGPNRSRTIIRDLAEVDGAWLALAVCPTEEGLAAFRQARQAEAQEQARARALAAEVGAPLAAELRALLRDGRRIEAVRRYRQFSGEGLAMSRRVVELLETAGP